VLKRVLLALVPIPIVVGSSEIVYPSQQRESQFESLMWETLTFNDRHCLEQYCLH